MQFDQSTRRELIALLGGAAAWPLAARAQRATPVVGFLGNTSGDKTFIASFRQGLEQIGYIEGRNIAIEYRWTEGQYDRAAALAADLVALQVAVIVSVGLPLALAAKAATTTIPIVFLIGDDPVKFGLVASLNRPGGNITGFSFLAPIEAKRVELLHELVPKASTIAALVNPKFSSAEVRVTAVRDAATALGLELTVYNASSESEIDIAFASIAERQIGALLVTADPFFDGKRDQIVRLAARYALPTLYFTRQFAEDGGLMSYGSDAANGLRRVGVYAGRILKGERPADMPVEQPTKFELVLNLRTARTLGLEIQPRLLALADEVIE
jgi:putative tryptophan/tyrosine transport system substrate-binding protein